MSSGQRFSIPPEKIPRLLTALSVVILVAGLSCAAWIWQMPKAEPNGLSSLGLALSPDDSAKYQHQVEIYSGKLGVMADRWTRRAGELTHGKPLAATIAVCSLMLAGCCLAGSALVKRLQQPQSP